MILAPLGIPVPLIPWPMLSPEVLVTEMMVAPLFADAPGTDVLDELLLVRLYTGLTVLD